MKLVLKVPLGSQRFVRQKLAAFSENQEHMTWTERWGFWRRTFTISGNPRVISKLANIYARYDDA